MRVTFEIAGDRQIARELLRFSGRAVDASPAFEAIGELLIEEERKQFDTQGAHASGGWKPLKPATLAAKQRKGLRLEILQATGPLMDSLTEKGDAHMIFEAHPTELVFGSAVPYAPYHQTGTHRGLPRRRPIELTEATRKACVKILQRWLVAGELA